MRSELASLTGRRNWRTPTRPARGGGRRRTRPARGGGGPRPARGGGGQIRPNSYSTSEPTPPIYIRGGATIPYIYKGIVRS